MGNLQQFQGDPALALRLTEAAKDLGRAIGDAFTEAYCLCTLGHIESGFNGSFDKADRIYDDLSRMIEDSALRRSLGERPIDMLRVRGVLAFYQGNVGDARAYWRLMKQYATEMSSDHWQARAEARLSLVAQPLDFNQMKQAWINEKESLQARRERASFITACGEVAEVCIRRREMDEAIAFCDEAEVVAKEADTPHIRSGIAYVRGVRAIAEGDLDIARRELSSAEKLFASWAGPYRWWVAGVWRRLTVT